MPLHSRRDLSLPSKEGGLRIPRVSTILRFMLLWVRLPRSGAKAKGFRGCHHKRPNTQNKLMQGKRAPLPCGNGNARYFLEPNIKHKCNSHRLERHARATTRQEELGSCSQFARRSSGMPNWTLEFTCGLATGLVSPVHGSRKELLLQTWLTTKTNCMHVATGSVNTSSRRGVARSLAALALQHLPSFTAFVPPAARDQQVSDQFKQTNTMI